MSVEQNATPRLSEKTPLVIHVESPPSHAVLHSFDSLSVMEVQSSAKLSSKFEAAKTGFRHGNPIDAWNVWFVNALIGFVCGLVSFFLKECIGFLFRTRAALVVGAIEAGGAGWMMNTWCRAVGFAAVLLLISASTILFFEPHAAGSGIPETCAFLNGVIIPKTFTPRVVLAKFVSCALAVGSGIPAGPEGPMIHMGSILGSLVSQGNLFVGHLECFKAKIEHFRNISHRRDFMAAGVAGGVAAAFGAPIGGLLFVAEEIASHFDMQLGMQIFLCSTCACVTVEVLTSAFSDFTYTGSFGMIKEGSAVLFDVNKEIGVNILMFPPTVLLGVLGGLLGALFNTICLAATDFRGKYIKKHKLLFLLEPIGVAAVYCSAIVYIPSLFACQRSDCESSSGVGCERVGQALVDDGMAFGCPADGEWYNPSATLMINSGEDVIKQLFARGYHYQFDYYPLLAMLCVYLPLSAYTNGISCSTGIVVPCLLNGALIGRLFGLLVTDMAGGAPGEDDESRQWIDPGAFALLGAASFFGGVARITMALTVIITEISNDTTFILPIMAAIMVAKWTGDYTGVHPIYHALMAKKNLPYLGTSPHTPAPLDVFVAGQIATSDVKTMQLATTVPEIARLLRDCAHNAFPVVEHKTEATAAGGGLGPEQQRGGGTFLGLVRREHLLGILKSPKLWINSNELPLPPRFEGKFTDAQLASFRELFAFYDKDGSGDIDRKELAHILESLGEPVTEAKLDAMVAEVDEDGDGDLSWYEFLQIMAHSDHSMFRSVVEQTLASLSADELTAQELLAFDSPEELYALTQELTHLADPATHGKFRIDLTPYIDRSAFSVPLTFNLATTYSLFRSMGLRHLVVVDAGNVVSGMITRHNLLEKHLQALLTAENIRTPDDILVHHMNA